MNMKLGMELWEGLVHMEPQRLGFVSLSVSLSLYLRRYTAMLYTYWGADSFLAHLVITPTVPVGVNNG